MVDLCIDAGARVLLLGMKMPPNYGRRFTERFYRVYFEVAAEKNAPLLPFFLQGVAESTALMQADGVHPNAAGQPRMLDNVWAYLEPMLRRSQE